MVANLVDADLMIILTDQVGFFDKNPTLDLPPSCKTGNQSDKK